MQIMYSFYNCHWTHERFPRTLVTMTTSLQTRPTVAPETSPTNGWVSALRRTVGARRARHGAMAAQITALPATRGVSIVFPR